MAYGVSATDSRRPVQTRPAQGPNIDGILATIRSLESGSPKGNYSAKNKTSTASGAYQFLDSTWRGLAPNSGYMRAADAPPAVQDQVARDYVLRILQSNGGDVASIPQTWYVGTTKYGPNSSYVPKGNTLSVGQYVANWLRIYGTLGGGNGTSPDPGNSQTQIADTAGYQKTSDDHCLISSPEIVMPSSIPNIPSICFMSTNKARAVGGAALVGVGGFLILAGLSLLALGKMPPIPSVPGSGYLENRRFNRAAEQGAENARNAPRTSAGGVQMLGRSSEPFPEG